MCNHSANNDSIDDSGFPGDGTDWLEQIRDACEPIRLGVLGQFEILSEVGRGGQGIVYEAIQIGTGRRVAIKRMLAGRFANDRNRWRLKQEALTAASLSHPGLVTILDVCEIDGQPVLAMEWIDGVRIDRYVKENSLSAEEIVGLMIDVCGAIQHAHSNGILHRDIKPTNILVGEDGAAHVIDFGLATRLIAEEDRRHVTAEGVFIGTIAYTAPERLEAGGSGCDARADVYSIGAVLYELLTGEALFSAESATKSYVDLIRNHTPARPSRACSGIASELDHVVLKALEKEPGRRYQTADGLGQDLERWCKNLPVFAHPPSRSYQLQKLVVRHKVGTAAFLMALVALVSLTAASVLFGVGERRERARAEHAEVHAETQAAISANIEEFIERVFETAKPSFQGRDATIEDAIDYATTLLDDVSDDDVKTSLHFLIGRVYGDLGRYEDAIFHFDEVVDRLSVGSLLEDADELSYRAEIKRGTAWLKNGEVVLAESLFADILGRIETDFGPGHRLTLQAHVGHGFALSRLDSMDEAWEEIHAALELGKRLYGATDFDMMIAANHIAAIASKTGHYEEAVSLFEEGLAVRKERFDDEDHPMVLTGKYNLGTFYMQNDQLALAEPLISESFLKRKVVLGERHPKTLNAMSRYASLRGKQGHHMEARALFEACIELRRDELGADHPETLSSLHALGLFHLETGDFEASAGLLRECLDRRIVLLGREHSSTVTTRSVLGVALMKIGELAESLELQGQVVRRYTALYGADSDKALRAEAVYALTLAEMGRDKESLEILDRLHELRRERFGADHPKTAIVLAQMYQPLFNMGRFDRAIENLVFAKEVFSTGRSGISGRLLHCSHSIGLAMEADGRLDEAADTMQETVDLFNSHDGEPSARFALLLYDLGRVYLEGGRFGEAEVAWLEQQAVVELIEIQEAGSHDTHENLALLYSSWREKNPRVAEVHQLEYESGISESE